MECWKTPDWNSPWVNIGIKHHDWVSTEHPQKADRDVATWAQEHYVVYLFWNQDYKETHKLVFS